MALGPAQPGYRHIIYIVRSPNAGMMMFIRDHRKMFGKWKLLLPITVVPFMQQKYYH